jgi:hypothetical protein
MWGKFFKADPVDPSALAVTGGPDVGDRLYSCRNPYTHAVPTTAKVGQT